MAYLKTQKRIIRTLTGERLFSQNLWEFEDMHEISTGYNLLKRGAVVIINACRLIRDFK